MVAYLSSPVITQVTLPTSRARMMALAIIFTRVNHLSRVVVGAAAPNLNKC